jgi:hypothetical protein
MPHDPSAQDPTPGDPPQSRIGRLRSGAEPIVSPVTSAVGAAMAGLRELPGSRVRRIRRLGRTPLPSLYDVHPEARKARPVHVGVVTIPVDEIRGTAVGGGDQRGGDFLPLKPFRGSNWAARWQGLRRADERLATLPPIDVMKYDGGYWVDDGHNRVALALYAGQPDIDANVIELVPPGQRRSEPIVSLAGVVEESRAVRSRASTETFQPDDAGDGEGPAPAPDR